MFGKILLNEDYHIKCGQPFYYGYHLLKKVKEDTFLCLGYHPETPANIPQDKKGVELSLYDLARLYSEKEYNEAREAVFLYAEKLHKEHFKNSR